MVTNSRNIVEMFWSEDDPLKSILRMDLNILKTIKSSIEDELKTRLG